MAKINGEFRHDYIGLTIEVLEPTKDEATFEEGMQIRFELDSFSWTDLDGLKNLAHWMLEISSDIEKNYSKDGKLKKSSHDDDGNGRD